MGEKGSIACFSTERSVVEGPAVSLRNTNSTRDFRRIAILRQFTARLKSCPDYKTEFFANKMAKPTMTFSSIIPL